MYAGNERSRRARSGLKRGTAGRDSEVKQGEASLAWTCPPQPSRVDARHLDLIKKMRLNQVSDSPISIPNPKGKKSPRKVLGYLGATTEQYLEKNVDAHHSFSIVFEQWPVVT